MTKPIALLIDDEPDIRELLAISLGRKGFDCIQAGSFHEGKQVIEAADGCSLCITDVRMPDGSGIDLVKYFKMRHPYTPIAVMTAFDTTDIAVQAMKAGAFDFLAKPIRAQRLDFLIKEAQSIGRSSEIVSGTDKFSWELLGVSDQASKLRNNIRKASLSLAPVFIAGESGSGKEAVARAIHENSQRQQGPFVTVNCSSIPVDMLEREFFGNSAGAFGDASPEKLGFLRSAVGGTIFLNEVMSLPEHFQASLLNVLKERALVPIGSHAKEAVDVRVTSASQIPLESANAEYRLREDFYYHLNVIDLQTTPLRKRPEDIKTIARALIDGFVDGENINVSDETLKRLEEHEFRGNIRELKNILHKADAMREGQTIDVQGLDFTIAPINGNEVGNNASDPLSVTDLEAHLSSIEYKIIQAALEEERWNQTRAAKRLGLTPRQFRYKLAKYKFNGG